MYAVSLKYTNVRMYRQSAIVLGPVCSGKRCVAAHIGGAARRQLTLDECVEWAIAASGKKKKLEAAGVENARLVEELVRSVEAQDGEGEVSGVKKSTLVHLKNAQLIPTQITFA